MLSTIKSIALHGLDGYLIEVQVDVSAGMPYWEEVGLPDASIKEAKERVRTAIKNSGYDFQSRKIVVNLAPADVRKEGTYFDLPIAIGILINFGIIKIIDKDNNLREQNIACIGELSLDGRINKVNGILPICIEAKKLGITKIIVPKENAMEGSIVEGIEIIGVSNLKETVQYLNKQKYIECEKSNIKETLKKHKESDLDFADVIGQENIKRALEVAAAGGHNCILIGNPGSGKTMMAKRIPSILPDLTFEESLEVTKIYSIAGILPHDEPIITQRQYRAPHHTISKISMVGGGKIPKPGEISLAHYGVLFLDELPEFTKEILELLRVPLEDGKITISRLNATLTYPCKFMFIASMNPCPCGYYGSKDKKCTCSPKAIQKYMGKISGPLLDRIDIQIEVPPIKYEKIEANDKIETSTQIKQRVDKARNIQINRYKSDCIFSNSELTPRLIKKYCKLNDKSKQLLKNAFERLGLSARAYNRILKVARTIADLDEENNILEKHIAEAIQYRNLDRKYWKN